MKKFGALLLTLTLAATMITACGKDNGGEAVKTGLAVITSVGSSKAAAADAEGTAQVDSTVVAVLVGADGKIVDCSIDAAQTKVNFTNAGAITTDLATVFPSKQDLGTAYGMSAVTGGKEWNEQANAFADYVVGKTIEEVRAIAVTEAGAPSDADLSASVTIKVGGYIAAIEKAVANAKELGAKSGDKLGLAVNTTIAKSADATAEAAGKAQAYTTYVAVSTGSDKKITSAVIDSSQSDVAFDATGAITTDLAVAPQTKVELGDAYGMAAVTGGKEWYVQAESLAAYVTGKTVDEVKGIAVDETTAPTDEDLRATVTVKIGDYITGIDQAVAKAK